MVQHFKVLKNHRNLEWCKGIIDPLVPKDISSGGGLFNPNFFQSLGVGVANDGLDWGWEAKSAVCHKLFTRVGFAVCWYKT